MLSIRFILLGQLHQYFLFGLTVKNTLICLSVKTLVSSLLSVLQSTLLCVRAWDVLGPAENSRDLQALTGCIGLSQSSSDNRIQQLRACKSVLFSAGPKTSQALTHRLSCFKCERYTFPFPVSVSHLLIHDAVEDEDKETLK